MPIYEYRCEACGHEFERLMKLRSPAPSCPNCRDGDVRKLVSAGSFVLVGAGWYRDHYGLKKGGDASPGAKGADSAGSSAPPPPSPKAAAASTGGEATT